MQIAECFMVHWKMNFAPKCHTDQLNGFLSIRSDERPNFNLWPSVFISTGKNMDRFLRLKLVSKHLQCCAQVIIMSFVGQNRFPEMNILCPFNICLFRLWTIWLWRLLLKTYHINRNEIFFVCAIRARTHRSLLWCNRYTVPSILISILVNYCQFVSMWNAQIHFIDWSDFHSMTHSFIIYENFDIFLLLERFVWQARSIYLNCLRRAISAHVFTSCMYKKTIVLSTLLMK